MWVLTGLEFYTDLLDSIDVGVTSLYIERARGCEKVLDTPSVGALVLARCVEVYKGKGQGYNSAGNMEDQKSISAGIQFVIGVNAGLQYRKQTAVPLSTAEAEFVAAAVGGAEIFGGQGLMMKIGMQLKTPVVLRMDNKAVIK